VTPAVDAELFDKLPVAAIKDVRFNLQYRPLPGPETESGPDANVRGRLLFRREDVGVGGRLLPVPKVVVCTQVVAGSRHKVQA
jgi:hypothetical protein